MRRSVDDVGAAHRILVFATARDPDLGEVPDSREHLLRRARLHARAEDREHAGIGTREETRRERGRGGRAHRGDVRPVHERRHEPRFRVEEDDRRLVGRERRLVRREEGDELRAEPGLRDVAGHRAEQPRRRERGHARRERRLAGRQLRVRTGECLEERIEIEQPLHLRTGEHEHQRNVNGAERPSGFPSAPSATTRTARPPAGAGSAVSNPRRGTGDPPGSTRQDATSVAPFQLA